MILLYGALYILIGLVISFFLIRYDMQKGDEDELVDFTVLCTLFYLPIICFFLLCLPIAGVIWIVSQLGTWFVRKAKGDKDGNV